MSAPAKVRGLYLDGSGEPVFGLLHRPAGARTSNTAVLICPPFGWEEVCSYRSRREWAEQLAARGYATLRIDLPSTGDSPGSPEDPDRLTAWTGAVTDGARWLREGTGVTTVAGIGIGLGGMLLCAASAVGAPIEELALWSVPAHGRTLVRELRAFERMESSRLAIRSGGTSSRSSSPPAAESNGLQASAGSDSVSVGGFALSAATVTALEKLDLTELSLPAGRPRRVLLLERDGIGVDDRLRGHLERHGAIVRIGPGDGYAAMMAEPQESRPPAGVFAQVEDWLGEARRDPSPIVRPRSPGSVNGGERRGGDERRSGAPAAADAPTSHPASGTPAVQLPAPTIVTASDSTELDVAGVRIRERPLTIEQPGWRLFGIITEPAEARPPGLGAVFLNAGAIRRIGPNRMWVEIARRWAARGIPSLRIDLEGIGDSDGDASRYADVGELYEPQFSSQVETAIDALVARGLARRFVLAGLCSGAYWSFHAALEDERVVAAFMLNPRTLFWDPSVENVRYLRRGLVDRSSWRMIMAGEVSPRRVARVLRRAPRSLLARGISRWRRRGERDVLELALDQLTSNDKGLTFVFSEHEPLLEELVQQGRLGHSERWPNIELDLVPGSDHTLRPAVSQSSAHDALDRALYRELERLRG